MSTWHRQGYGEGLFQLRKCLHQLILWTTPKSVGYLLDNGCGRAQTTVGGAIHGPALFEQFMNKEPVSSNLLCLLLQILSQDFCLEVLPWLPLYLPPNFLATFTLSHSLRSPRFLFSHLVTFPPDKSFSSYICVVAAES